MNRKWKGCDQTRILLSIHQRLVFVEFMVEILKAWIHTPLK